VAAGIGGGSADAAATLRILSRLWRVPERDAVCSRLAPRLGADVPVCLGGRPAFMGGVGERLSPAPELPSLWAVLVNPGVPVSTPAVFAAFARSGAPFSQSARFRRAPADALEFARLLRERRNDLGPPALELAPPVGRALAALDAQPAALLARMSGSGATCFALFDREHHARSAARAIRRAEPAWWVAAAPIMNKPAPVT
jgi:4-diphosphocytidyl-2-C-methyl-D-erythritol kinase